MKSDSTGRNESLLRKERVSRDADRIIKLINFEGNEAKAQRRASVYPEWRRSPRERRSRKEIIKPHTG